MSLCRDSGLEVLGEVACRPAFKPWELGDNKPRVKVELAAREPSTLALDLLHKAAFRNTGLGNSLYIENHNLGKISSPLVGFMAFLY